MADASSAAAAEVSAARRFGWPTMLLVATLALGAAAAGVYFLMPPAADAPGRTSRVVPKAPAVYIKFDPPMVVNFEAKGMTRYLQVGIEIMTRDPVTADMIQLHEPRLRNDLLMLLGGQEYATLSTREGKDQLRQEALEAVHEVIVSEGGDPAKVEQLFFTSFVMQ